jgi:hypothetical protein
MFDDFIIDDLIVNHKNLTKEKIMNLKNLKELASKNNKNIKYNRNLGGYQVISGFNASEVVMAWRNEKGKLVLDQKDLELLSSYI